MRDFSVSLIIPTFNRAAFLAATLDEIASSAFDLDRLEVIVVDDGSSDGTSDIRSNIYPFFFRYLRQQNQGDAIARNEGAQISQGELLVFLDDDIRTTPELLANLKAAYQGRERVIVVGRLILAQPGDSKQIQPLPDPITKVPFTECQSGLMAIGRLDFIRLGMFQPLDLEGSSIWCDVEFAYRADLAGYSFIKSTEAIGFHHDYTQLSLETKSERMHRIAKAGVLLLQRHPQLLGNLPMFLDKSVIRWRQDPSKLIIRKIARTFASTRPSIRLLEGLYLGFSILGHSSGVCGLLERWIIGGYLFRGFRQGLREFNTHVSDNWLDDH